ncbi:MAG TPA: hydroxyisourate hydrolase [Acidobacteriota bacterium]|jgi:5-hydroxyisourate hydrolase
MPGQITTHVLDTAHGHPAANMKIELWRIDVSGERKRLLKDVTTNADGRTDKPLLEAGEMENGIYELIFFVGDYFSTIIPTSDSVRFLDRVPVRFGISDVNVRYHIPLLASPWAYSTYRGS